MAQVRRTGVIRDLRELWNAVALVTGNLVLIGLLVYGLAQMIWPY
jgi:hypothetical protein